MTLTLFSLLVGMLIMGGLLMMVSALRTPQPDLHSAMANLSSAAPSALFDLDQVAGSVSGRVGRWVLAHLPVRPSPKQLALLRLRGMSASEFYGLRTLYAIGFAAFPWLFQLVSGLLQVSISLSVPAILTIVLALIGWFAPAMMLGQKQTAVTDDTYEAFIVLMDLVVLERLANAAAIDAITNAAFVSDAPLFVQVQRTLNRAVLENTTPWAGLSQLADEIQLPELNDLVSIALLQDQGASLVDSLRARTDELRNVSLLRIQDETTHVTQRMVFAKMLPPMSVMILLFGAMLLNLLLQGGSI